MRLAKAERCAWRGRYLYTKNGRQLARITLDPSHGNKPRLTIAFPIGWYKNSAGRHPRLKTINITMPYLGWKTNMGRIRLRIYKFSQWFWHKMDGRYGWGA